LQREEGTNFTPGWVLPFSALFMADPLPFVTYIKPTLYVVARENKNLV
jgi:hypothetical protein